MAPPLCHQTRARPAGASAGAYVAMGELGELRVDARRLDADPDMGGARRRRLRWKPRSATICASRPPPSQRAPSRRATEVPTLAAALPGGQIEVSAHRQRSPSRRTLYFAIKGGRRRRQLGSAVERGHAGDAGRCRRRRSAIWPWPAPGTTSVTLTFTATGDDGMVGNATSYDLRFAPHARSRRRPGTAPRRPRPAAPHAPRQQGGRSRSPGCCRRRFYYFCRQGRRRHRHGGQRSRTSSRRRRWDGTAAGGPSATLQVAAG